MDKGDINDKKDTAPPTQAQLDYQARQKRINDAISLKKPDRVPLVIMDGDLLLAQRGMTCAEINYDIDRAFTVYLEQFDKYYNQDMVTLPFYFPGQLGEVFGIKTMKWAGFHKGINEYPIQFVEKEYMLAEEYDQFLKNPGDFVLRTLWPRQAEGLEPFGMFPNLTYLSHGYSVFTDIPMLLHVPPVREMLKKLIQVGDEMGKIMEAVGKAIGAFAQKGYPTPPPPLIIVPFDMVSDMYRGMKGTMLDMYYRPDKLKALIELVTTPIIENAIRTAKNNWVG